MKSSDSEVKKSVAQEPGEQFSVEELDTWAESNFAEMICNPLEWFEHSRALIATARITKKRYALLINRDERRALENTCSLLYGLSLENLFKAHWILNKFGEPHTQDWLPEAQFPKNMMTHDLIKLSKKIDFKVDSITEHVLGYLTESIMWSGRYPCALKPGDTGTFFHPETFTVAESIYSLLKTNFTISD